MATTRNDFATQLLLFLLEKIPATLEPWGQAMLAELAVIDGFWTRLRWSLGGGMTLVTASIRLIIGSSGPEEDRRLDVSLIVGYQFLFSAMLMGVLTWQLPRITESWSYAVPALIICYALSALPAVLGLGLALRDEGARIGTIILSAVHALVEFEYFRRGLARYVELTALRIAIDVAIIIVLNRRVVRRAFQLSPITLQLRG